MAANEDVKYPKRQVLMYWLLLAILSALAGWALVFVHEALGHCLMGQLAGCDVYGFHVGLEFYGYASASAKGPDFDGPVSAQWLMLMLGGHIANILSGSAAAAWLSSLLKRGSNRRILLLFLALFALYSVVGQTLYAFAGIVYGVGDGPFYREYDSLPPVHRWLPFLVLIPFVTYLFMALYVNVQARFFPLKSPKKRFSFSLLTLGSLWLLLSLVFLVSFSPEILRGLKSTHVARYEITLLPVFGFLYLLLAGAFTACWRTNAGSEEPYQPLSMKGYIMPSTAAAAIVVFLTATGGTFNWPRFGAGLPRYPGTVIDEAVDDDVAAILAPGTRWEVGADGRIYTTRFGEGTLRRTNPATGKTETVLSDLQRPKLVTAYADRIYFTIESPPQEGDYDLLVDLLFYDVSSGTTGTKHNRLNVWQLSESETIVSADRVLMAESQTMERRTIVICAEGGGENQLFAELPAQIPGEIQCLAEGPDGAVYATAGDGQPNERNVLLRLSQDGSSCAVVAEGLSTPQKMAFDANGDLYIAAHGRSSLILVENATVPTGAAVAWELREGWRDLDLSISTPRDGSFYLRVLGCGPEKLHRLTIKDRIPQDVSR